MGRNADEGKNTGHKECDMFSDHGFGYVWGLDAGGLFARVWSYPNRAVGTTANRGQSATTSAGTLHKTIWRGNPKTNLKKCGLLKRKNQRIYGYRHPNYPSLCGFPLRKIALRNRYRSRESRSSVNFAKTLLILGFLVALPGLHGADILLVTNNDGTTQSLRDFLVASGHNVTRDARTGGPSENDETDFDLVIVARETSSGKYDDGTEPEDWNGLGIPIINMAPYIMRSSIWGWVNGTSLPSLGNVSEYDAPFVDPAHPIVLGVTGSLLNPPESATGLSNALPAGSVQVATLGGGASHGIFVIPAGTPLGAGVAGAVRIGFIRGNEGAWDNATANGEQILINTIGFALGISQDPPQITNGTATGIEPIAATLNGTVADPGGAIPDVTIYYGTNDGGTDPGAWDTSVNLGSQSGDFSAGVTGLTPATTYHFRCYGINVGGEDWADSTASFMTAPPPNPPTVVNHSATGIDYTLAELNGEVTGTGGEIPTVIIHWGDDDGDTNPLAWDHSIEIGEQDGSFTREVVGLSDGTTCFFRASATNSGATSWASSTASFATPAYSLPTVVNTPATGITGISAGIGGEVTTTGGDAPTITIYYGTSDGGTDTMGWDDSLFLDLQSGVYSGALTGLSPTTTYHFRAYAINGAGGTWAPTSETFASGPFSALVINEFLASNDGTYSNYPDPNQVTGRTDDWIEILNTSPASLGLDGWHLTDDAANPAQWTFPAGTTIAAGEFLVVYTSGDGVPDANGNLHTNFRLAAGGEYVALVRPDLTVAAGFGPGGTDYPEQETDVSYGIHPVTALPAYFSVPTPGGPNDVGGIDRVQDTTFSVDRGIYDAPFDVTIATDTPTATIYFTTDGEPPIDAAGAPTATATAYSVAVNIAETTVLRAAAVKTSFAPTNIDTQTYILIDIPGAGPDGFDPGGLNAVILEQTQPAGYPTLADGDSRTEDDGDYDMDQTISKSTDLAQGFPSGTTRAQALVQGLVDIPTLSIAMAIDDFAGPDNGIYTHAGGTGFAWERACSTELIQGDNSDAWQEDCGIRVQGGASRTRSPKHGLSLRFRETYGAGKLKQNLFPDSKVRTFDTLAIRAGYNNSWIHWNAGQRDRGSMIRDQWARSTMLDMGNPEAGHGMMVHLYINGLYWGVHNLTERQDSSHYAEHNGGDEDLLDARNAGSFVDGNSTAWDEMETVVSGGDWSLIRQVLDIDTHIDYQIMNRFGGNSDLHPGNNWRAAGGGPFPPGQPELMAQWQVYSWDAERTLEDQNRSAQSADPTGLRTTLLALPEYKIRFADRLQKHFFNGGALTTTPAKNRWMKWAELLDRPIIAEAARWGDHREDDGSANEVYDRNDDWLTEQARLYNTYFPVRSANVLQNYRDDGMFPNFDAPVFHVNGSPQHGGDIPQGGSLSLVAPAGTILYTLDGSDPRLPGGGANSAAQIAVSGDPVVLSMSALVRTRTLVVAEWSALNEAEFYVGPQPSSSSLVISEIMYNPLGTSEDAEYIELMNISATDTIDLSGAAFDEGVNFVFAVGSELPPLARIVIASDQVAFAAAYGTGGGTLATGEFTDDLSNSGEVIGLVTRDGADIRRFAYDDFHPWPESADGDGYSLVLVAPDTNPDHSLPESWRASVAAGGSPGGTDATPLAGDPLADDDGDGKSALIEHAIGHSDADPSDGPVLTSSFGSFDVGGMIDDYLTVSFTRNLAAADVTISVELSEDLQLWSMMDVEFVSSVNNGDGTTTETYRSATPAADVDRQFFRLNVSM